MNTSAHLQAWKHGGLQKDCQKRFVMEIEGFATDFKEVTVNIVAAATVSHRQYSTSFGQLERSFSQRKSRMISAWLRSNSSPPVLANPRHPTTPRDRAQQVESQQRMGPLILQSPNRSRMETRRRTANKIRLLVSHSGSHGSTRTKSWPVSRPPSLF